MKLLNISKNIKSLSDFKNKASRMLHEVQSSHRPLVITQKGNYRIVYQVFADRLVVLTVFKGHRLYPE